MCSRQFSHRSRLHQKNNILLGTSGGLTQCWLQQPNICGSRRITINQQTCNTLGHNPLPAICPPNHNYVAKNIQPCKTGCRNSTVIVREKYKFRVEIVCIWMRRGFSVWTRALPLINQAATTIFWGIAKVPLCLIFDSRRFLLRHVQVCIVPIVTFQCAFPHPGRASVPRTHEGETLVSQHPGFLPRGKPKKHSGPPQVLNSWSVKILWGKTRCLKHIGGQATGSA